VEDFQWEQRTKFGIVDVDPFGSPAPYIRHCVQLLSDGGILQVGATDSTVLSGLYPRIALERYGGTSARTSFAKELGVRLLLRSIAIVARGEDFEIRPLVCHTSHHYTRIYVRLVKRRGPTIRVPSDNVSLCGRCGKPWNSESGSCSGDCHDGHQITAGPFWAGPIQDRDFLDGSVREAKMRNLDQAAKVLKVASGEADMPSFYS